MTEHSGKFYIMDLDMDKINAELKQIPEYDDQIMLQGIVGQKDPFFGIGRTENFEWEEDEFIKPLFDMPYTNQIMSELKMFRTRLMKMEPRTCYSWHRDKTPRVHIPIITHQNCQFVLAQKNWDSSSVSESRFLDVGKAYYIDTTRLHTAFNGSSITRVHIVGCVHSV